MKGLLVGLSLALGVGFLAGRASVPAPAPVAAAVAAAVPTAAAAPGVTRPLTAGLQNDPRELIPLVPGPGEGPGQTPPGSSGPQRPGQAPGEGECTVLMFRDGQFYQLQPGVPPPGQPQPGPGEQGDGQPGGDQELFPLEPFEAPPSLPGEQGAPGLDLRV